ncbi:MAG: DUF3089 domain-containing protein [Victivallales bacterium]|nr:DUF3089 domain-containing protein [Victivallales bacterium]
MMAKTFSLFKWMLVSTVLLLNGTGCYRISLNRTSFYERFYDDQKNWVVLDSCVPTYYSEFDIFYLYPTQMEKLDSEYLNWLQGNQVHEIHNYVRIQTSNQFGPRVRIFSPYVPQISFDKYNQLLMEYQDNLNQDNLNQDNLDVFSVEDGPLSLAIENTVMALRYYMSHYHKPGSPFFLIGNGQGAVILYEAFKQCYEIKPSKGFIAAYFFGLPGLSAERITKDFKKHGIRPATGRDDLGVIAIINTQLPDTPLQETFGKPGCYVINPLNWRTDDTPASRELNEGAIFYKRTEKYLTQRSQTTPYYCGATVDPENGVIKITELPERSLDLNLEERAFQSNIWGLYGKNIALNAGERVKKYFFNKKILRYSDAQE